MDRHEYKLAVFKELMVANLNAAREFLNLSGGDTIPAPFFIGEVKQQTEKLVTAIQQIAEKPSTVEAPRRRGRPTKASTAVVEIKEVVVPAVEADPSIDEEFVEEDVNVEIEMGETDAEADTGESGADEPAEGNEYTVDVKAGLMPKVTKEWVLANEEHMADQCRELASKYFTKHGIEKTKALVIELTGFDAISKFPTPDLLYVYYTAMCPLVRA